MWLFITTLPATVATATPYASGVTNNGGTVSFNWEPSTESPGRLFIGLDDRLYKVKRVTRQKRLAWP